VVLQTAGPGFSGLRFKPENVVQQDDSNDNHYHYDRDKFLRTPRTSKCSGAQQIEGERSRSLAFESDVDNTNAVSRQQSWKAREFSLSTQAVTTVAFPKGFLNISHPLALTQIL
jgi:hypothetical protein